MDASVVCVLCRADHPASLALHRPVSGEAAGGDHRSYHPGLQHPPADSQLHQGQHWRQGACVCVHVRVGCPGKCSVSNKIVQNPTDLMWVMSTGNMPPRRCRMVIAGITSDDIVCVE